MHIVSHGIHHRQLAVAIPVRNEADHIGACLEALDGQIGVALDHIVLLVNNSSDGTAAIAHAMRPRLTARLHVIERTFPSECANAGNARRLAMDEAAALVGQDGILMATDADGLVDPDWASATLSVFAEGIDAVAGWIELHPLDWGSIPMTLHEIDARECAYDALCDEIHGLLDPDPADPLPRHTQASGASIAVTAEAFEKCGGVPSVACGEDRALITALRRIDARIRHAPEVHATVSGRTVGRAAGGMADTIQRRLLKPDEFIDGRLEPARACARRAASRARLREIYCSPRAEDLRCLSLDLGIAASTLGRYLSARYFGEAWEAIEAASPSLQRQTVATADLAAETAIARDLLAGLRVSRTDSRIGADYWRA